jgi:hypothetical protein
MKKLVFLSLFLPLFSPLFSKAQFTITNSSTVSLLELRTGTWPLDLEKVIKETDTCYVLEFRDQQYTNVVNMSTLRFGNLAQVKYFQKGLSALKSGTTGDIAKFKDYTIKRVDVKKDPMTGAAASGIWYTLTVGDGELTNFQQSDADKMIAVIKGL